MLINKNNKNNVNFYIKKLLFKPANGILPNLNVWLKYKFITIEYLIYFLKHNKRLPSLKELNNVI